MMIDHIAIWTNNLEKMKEFYCKYFNGTSNKKYMNKEKQFESYFISFNSGARLELMKKRGVKDHLDYKEELCGPTHIAFKAGTKDDVDNLIELFRRSDYLIVGEPRTTGDGYYEGVVLDPDGNKIEITSH